MVDDECWAVRAEADALKEEVAKLRGVVGALRAVRGDTVERAAPAQRVPMIGAFVFGVLVALAGTAIWLVAACP